MDRLDQQLGPAVLQQEAACAGLQRAVDVLVEVEGRDDDDGDRIGDVGAGELPRGLDAVDLGHADVEQAHVGPQSSCQRDRLAPVGRVPDDLDIRLRVEDHRQAGADELLVVGDEHADDHCPPARGRTAETVQPLPGPGPASRVPPSSAARSVMPTIP